MTSFFRHPDDESSEEISADDDSVEGNIELASSTQSLSTKDGISVGESNYLPSQSALPNVQHHRDMMLATLLEEWCKTRAVELMNNAGDGSNKFCRLSPEVLELAQKLYSETGQTLASTGFLPSAAISAERQPVRQQYLAGLDGISLRAFNDGDLDCIPGRIPLAGGDTNHSLALVRADRRHTGLLDIMNQPIGNIITQVSSPLSDMQLRYSRRPQGHYESCFQQLGLLGKGGFGRVYHAFNIFDRKHYAVKKIPLSVRMSQRYRESGHQELDSILREVQALAELDHPNVVRYHTSWIEEPKSQLEEEAISTQSNPRLIEIRPYQSPATELASTPVGSMSGNEGEDTVFGHDCRKDVASFVTMSQSHSFHIRDTADVAESDIFTDGNDDDIISNSRDTSIDFDVYVLHVQMSMYPLTLAHYISHQPCKSQIGRHCFHVIPSLKILLGILYGLQYIHAKGLIHRDIKPANIFLSVATKNVAIPDGFFEVGPCSSCQKTEVLFLNPRIGDFGLVAELAYSGRDITHSPAWRSKVVGTELYQPPSWHGFGRVLSEKLDIFSLGVILLELLWPCETTSERVHIMRELQEGNLPHGLASKIEAEGQHVAGLGAKIEGCIAAMTNKDPEQRWGCQEVKDCIEDVLQAKGLKKIERGCQVIQQ
ncbi:hypothetical protein DV738_g4317, partial [Chaetothyriales sp. CBS 135597]